MDGVSASPAAFNAALTRTTRKRVKGKDCRPCFDKTFNFTDVDRGDEMHQIICKISERVIQNEFF